MVKGSHKFAKFKLNIEMTSQSASRRDEARLMSWMNDSTGGNYHFISCEDIQNTVIRQNKLSMIYFGPSADIKVGGRLSYLTQIMAVDNAVNSD